LENLARTLITLGALLLASLVLETLGRRTRLPRVTLLLLLGLLSGPVGLDLLPDDSGAWYSLVAHIALVMVGFLLGGHFTRASLREHGRVIVWISSAEVLVTAGIVLAGLWMIGIPAVIALLLAGIATATAPAAITDLVRETRARGPFTRTLLGIVAIDDAWGLVLFSLLLAGASTLVGIDGFDVVLLAARDLGGAILLGIALGVPTAYLTGRMRPGEPTLAEVLGAVLVCAGLAVWLEVSFLLASMATGCVVANLARHHRRPFHAIENIERPFLILFFVLAGASLRPEALPEIGLLGAAYIVLRVLGRLVGGWVGAAAAGAGAPMRRWMGLALMPQAGVALGMALVTAERFPEEAALILPVVIGATILFELAGPVLARVALDRAGEIGDGTRRSARRGSRV
jgi:Kef-type K+ transport system membrane component KefB